MARGLGKPTWRNGIVGQRTGGQMYNCFSPHPIRKRMIRGDPSSISMDLRSPSVLRDLTPKGGEVWVLTLMGDLLLLESIRKGNMIILKFFSLFFSFFSQGTLGYLALSTALSVCMYVCMSHFLPMIFH